MAQGLNTRERCTGTTPRNDALVPPPLYQPHPLITKPTPPPPSKQHAQQSPLTPLRRALPSVHNGLAAAHSVHPPLAETIHMARPGRTRTTCTTIANRPTTVGFGRCPVMAWRQTARIPTGEHHRFDRPRTGPNSLHNNHRSPRYSGPGDGRGCQIAHPPLAETIELALPGWDPNKL